MTTQLVNLLVALLPVYVSLSAIAIGVLRLYQPRMVAAPVEAAPVIHVKRDVIHIDRTTPHYEALEHSATRNHYHFTERNGNMVTYVRDEYHGLAATWR